ncbi:T9SS type A sorting domain-containing protein [bacterium]|nr:T9SS type A sorting domain-containing protein [bacterium]
MSSRTSLHIRLASIFVFTMISFTVEAENNWFWESVNIPRIEGDSLLLDAELMFHIPGEEMPRFIRKRYNFEMIYDADPSENVRWVHSGRITGDLELSDKYHLSTNASGQVILGQMFDVIPDQLVTLNARIGTLEDNDFTWEFVPESVYSFDPNDIYFGWGHRTIIYSDLNNDGATDWLLIRGFAEPEDADGVYAILRDGDDWVFTDLSPPEELDEDFTGGLRITTLDLSGDGITDIQFFSGGEQENGLWHSICWQVVNPFEEGYQFTGEWQQIGGVETIQRVMAADIDDDGNEEIFASCHLGMTEWEFDGEKLNKTRLWSLPANIKSIYQSDGELVDSLLCVESSNHIWYNHDRRQYMYEDFLSRLYILAVDDQKPYTWKVSPPLFSLDYLVFKIDQVQLTPDCNDNGSIGLSLFIVEPEYDYQHRSTQFISRNRDTGQFVVYPEYSQIETHLYQNQIVELNGDGFPEIVFDAYGDEDHPFPGREWIIAEYLDSSWVEIVAIETPDGIRPYFFDLNGDGRTDMLRGDSLFINQNPTGEGNPDFIFDSIWEINPLPDMRFVSSVDFNMDSDIDLLDLGTMRILVNDHIVENSKGTSYSPVKLQISSAYPNPFNSSITLPITLPETGLVEINIFNVLGQAVYISRKQFDTGTHQIVINPTEQSLLSGATYFLHVSSENTEKTQRIIFLK